jgi:transposase
MSRFPTAAHLVSWAGLCPSARQSGPRSRAGKKGEGDTWLRGALGLAAVNAARTATFLGERYGRIARRRGKAKAKAKAQVAVARSILVIISLGHLAGGDWIRVGEIRSVAASTGLGNYCDASD